MIWREAIRKTGEFLDSKGVPDGPTASELMAARLLGCSRGFLVSHLDKEVSERHLEALRRGMRRLAAGEPLQYVLGEWDFRTLTLSCDSRALIPRPETEELVSRVLKWLKEHPSDSERIIIDVGTGTGAIILSLAAEYKGNAAFIGSDISEGAIALAKANAVRTGLSSRVKFVVMDGLDDFDEPECVDVIVSNPPYIERAVCETLDPRVKDFEPRLALDGGESGLDFYDRYLADALNILRPGGAVFFEIGENQGEALRELLENYGFSDIKIEKDFAGHDRYASGVLEV